MISIDNKKYAVVKSAEVKTEDILITKNGNYYPADGVTGFNLVRVKLPDPIYEELTIQPKTADQTFTSEKDGYSKVVAKGVTASIDSNIMATNIVKGVKILGVTGSVEFITENLNIQPKTTKQTFNPTKDGFKTVEVEPVTASIDSNIKSQYIKKGTAILGVVGNVIEANETTRDIDTNGVYTPPEPYTGFSEVNVQVAVKVDPLEVNPTTQQQIFNAVDAKHGFSPVTVNAVTSEIDSNITANNIRNNITILGVKGNIVELKAETRTETLTSTNKTTYTPSTGYNAISSLSVTPKIQTITITPTTAKQTKTVPSGYSGYGTITVNPVTASIDSNITPNNIKNGISILGVQGTCVETALTTQKITKNGTYQPPSPYNGFSSVEVDINTVNNTNLTVTDSGTYTPTAPYTGFGKVVVDLSWIEQALQELNAGDVATQVVLQNKTISTAGTYTCDSGYDGFGTITVNLDWVDAALKEARESASDGNLDNFLSGGAKKVITDATSIRSYAFYGSSVTQVTLNNATAIYDNGFANSTLTTLVINTPTLCTLGTSALPSTITSIKVPSALVDTYKSATNWANYSSKITSI